MKNISMDQITENIWLGNYAAGENVENLKKHNIKKVICLIEVAYIKYKEGEFDHKIIIMEDDENENIIKYFGECLNFMSCNENVLVHCVVGSSRSASIVIAYLMWKKKMKYEDAYSFVKEKRPIVLPNNGFQEQLKMFEKILEENDYDINKVDFNTIKWKGK